MRAENPSALRFILQDDIYLLKDEKVNINNTTSIPVKDIDPQPFAEITVIEAAPLINPEPATTDQPPATAALPLAFTETQELVYNYLGGNKKSFLILTDYPNEQFIAGDHLAALQNILNRKGFEVDDIAILNMAKNTNTAINTLLTFFSPEKMLVLGKAALPAGAEALPFNQPKKFKFGHALCTFSFDEMMDSTDNKKAFWEQVKSL